MVSIDIQRDVTRDLAKDIAIAEPAGRAYVWDFTQGVLTEGISFSRASSAMRYDQSGALVSMAADVPRFDYDPATLQPRGLLIEEARTNQLRNSATPETQTLSMNIGTFTLWVVGTGSCAVTAGTAVGSAFGTAVAGTPVVFSITTAGTVTFTVTGSVTQFQCEGGGYATSFIPTTTSAVTRSADICNLNIAGILNPVEGTFVAECTIFAGSQLVLGLDAGSGASTQRGNILSTRSNRQFSIATSGSLMSTPTQSGMLTDGTPLKVSAVYSTKSGVIAMSVNGGTPLVSSSVLNEPFTPTVARIGCRWLPAARDFFNAPIKKLTYYPREVSLSELSTMSV